MQDALPVKRKLALGGGVYFTTLFITYMALQANIWALAVLFYVFAAALFFILPRIRWHVLLAAGFFTAAALSYTLWDVYYFSALGDYTGGVALLSGTCLERSETSSGYANTLQVTHIDGKALHLPVKVLAFGSMDVEVGEEYRCEVNLFALDKNGGYYLSNISDGIVATAFTRQSGEVTGVSTHPRFFFKRLQSAVAENVRSVVSSPLAPVLTAIAVGDKTNLSAGVKGVFRRAGLSHILAVSGLHLTALALFVNWLLGKTKLSRAKRAAFLAGFVLAFMALTGLPMSILRAGVMFLISMAAPIFRREADGATTIGAALLLILFAAPYAAVSYAFLLSVACVCALLASSALLKWAKKRGDAEHYPRFWRVAGAVLPSVCIMLGTLPVFCIFGGGISILSPLTNLIAIPLAGPILVFTWLAGAFAFVPVLGTAFGLAAVTLANVLYTLAVLVDRIPGAYFEVSGLFPLLIALGILAVVFAAFISGGERALAKGAALALAFAVFTCSFAEFYNQGTIRVLMVEDASAAIITDGENALVIFGGAASDVKDVVYYVRAHISEDVKVLVNLSSPELDFTLCEGLNTRKVFHSADEIDGALSVINGARISFAQAGTGTVASLKTAGSEILICFGSVNASGFQNVTAVLAQKPPRGGSAQVLLCAQSPDGGGIGYNKTIFCPVNFGVWLRVGGGVKILSGV